MSSNTPAAVMQEGTTAGQRRVVATVGTLAAEAERARIAAPAVIVVGGVATLAEQFSWYEKLPLAGCRVVVTRPSEFVSAMAQRLRVLGAEVLELPAIATVPIEGNEVLAHAFERIGSYDWLVFTSPSGVRIFFDEMLDADVDHRCVRARVAALGQGTASALRKRGFIADLVPGKATGKALGEALAQVVDPADQVLIPRARIGNRELVEALAGAGCAVDDVATYDTAPIASELIDLKTQIECGRVFCVFFTSSSGVHAFAEANPDLDFSCVQAACIGEKTRSTAEGLGMHTWMSDEATMDSLCALVMERYGEAKLNGGL